MSEAEVRADIKILQQDFSRLCADMTDIKHQLKNGSEIFVRKELFEARLKPIQLVVYGMVALILTGVMGGLLTMIMAGPISYGG